MSAYGFLRWLRSGASAAIVTPRSGAGAALRASFTAVLTLTDNLGQQANPQSDLTLFGPGDVIGLDSRQVLRFSPQPESIDASYEQFPHVEFDEPALPWLFTPFQEETGEPAGAPAGALPQAGTVLPWLTLVVVAERAGVALGYTPGALLPVLHVDDVTRELPRLSDAHAWAHVQITGGLPATAEAFGTLLSDRPDLSLSRLICPRLLQPSTRYLACVIPVFKAGQLAGLGQPLTGVSAAGLSYDNTKPGPVDLPVYLHWSFTTAAAAGFEALVRRLVPRSGDELAQVGQRPLDVSDPGSGLPATKGASLPIGGALRIPGGSLDGAGKDLRDSIEQVVNQVGQVAPPLYGRWLAAVDRVPPDPLPGDHPPGEWMRQLNLEPRHRAAAGLGTQVVQAGQEDMMAAAWEQLGDILRANQLLRQGQLALAVGARMHRRHLAALSPYALLGIAGPALSRIRSAGMDVTLHGVLAPTCLPLVTLHASFRRVTRPRGPLARRATRLSDVHRGFDLERLFTRLINGDLRGASGPPAPPAVTLTGTERDSVITRLGGGPAGGQLQAVAARLRLLADRAVPSSCTPPQDDPPARALDQLRPRVTVPPRVRAQVVLPAGITAVDARLEPVLAAPHLDAAMYRPLAELGQDWLLPGLEHVPPNTITGVEPDDAFIEAYLLGLNHEMGRELLWRGYPTDQRGTVMARFWDLAVPSDQLSTPAETPPQIDNIHTWPAASPLGGHRPGRAPRVGLVLLLRGDLIRQFPRPGIVLAKAEWARGGLGQILRHPDGRLVRRPLPLAPETTAAPLFAGRLEPDVLFLGFTVTAAEACGVDEDPNGDPGYFALFAEQPTEPHFDLGAASGVPDPVTGRYRSWRDLGRADVKTDPAGHLDLALTNASPSFQALIPAGSTAWDGRSDTLASILLFRPFRLFIHASDLLPAGAA